ncbi:CbtA family protein [Streptomyces flavofungini]|uniref:CbtA family protein n=1 Tax=Streptomyces flavofungini TaxID=68200 RepID=UPI0025AF3A0A|nr:CbtA family protein [Streptomyces flavofungini]WJV48507.1 CbtA family protein [Streptomyces flavofungini]
MPTSPKSPNSPTAPRTSPDPTGEPPKSPETTDTSASRESGRSPVLPLLGRGMVAGALGGLVAGLFSLLLAEPLMDKAIRAEEARSHEHEPAGGAVQHHEELFSRSTQHAGLVIALVVAGIAIGVLFAVAYALVHRRDPRGNPWPRALAFCAAAFCAVSLFPALRYPAAPPGVGDAGTVGDRQEMWLGAVALGVLGMFLVWQVYVRLATRPVPVRQCAAAVTAVAVLALLWALPDNPDPVPVSATLLWDFRMLSLASHVLMWAVFAVVFGGLGLRALRTKEPVTADASGYGSAAPAS